MRRWRGSRLAFCLLIALPNCTAQNRLGVCNGATKSEASNLISFVVVFLSQNDLPRTLKLSGHVGFDSLPDQLVSKSVQNGFVFNILCIGETGLGKSTLMDSLFNTNFESQPSPHSLPNVKLKAHTYELQESMVRLKVRREDRGDRR